MKILFASHRFYPSIGGIEAVGLMLAEEFVRLGHKVRVLTQTREEGDRQLSFCVERRPSALRSLRGLAWCDVFLHNQISLQTAWPLLLVRRPWVVAHHTWLARPEGTLAWQDRLKRLLLRFSTSVSISRAIADSLPVGSLVLPDPYDDEVFCRISGVERSRELIFVGRLVSDKGLDVLIEALRHLRQAGLEPKLTVVGEGPERGRMQDLVCASGAGSQVVFLGAKTGRELAAQLNEHQILVVPSRWNEPFGIVALEGIACGCVVVGSSGGGLKQAIGPCGLTFPNGNAAALAEVLASLLRHPETRQPYTAKAEAHLQGHRRAVVAHAYLEVLQAATQRGTAFEPQRTKSCEKRLPAAPERGSPESQRVAGAVTAAVLENRAPTGHGRAP